MKRFAVVLLVTLISLLTLASTVLADWGPIVRSVADLER
jgi:hypothetical protein